MRRLRVRFTVRRMMIAVAIVALVAGMVVQMGPRRVRLDRMTKEFARQENYAWASAQTREEGHPSIARLERRGEFYGRMREKYEWAARYPFLPVWPDPPEPE